MASNYINIPTSGAPNWKSSVDTAVDLPTNGNSPGDARITLDTDRIYIWSGTMWVLATGGGGGGTVTSVGLTSANGALTITGSPVTTAGNIDLEIATADGTHLGLLSAADWNTFNNKQNALTIGNLTDVGTDGIVITGGTGAVIGTGTSLAQHVADTTHNGYLSSTDWNTFNNKQPAGSYVTSVTASAPLASSGGTTPNITITSGNLTDVGTDGITITNGTGAVIGTGTSISQHVADATHNGYLLSADWSTFNSKQPAGSYITALTGDVTATGPGSVPATVAKIQGTTVSGTTGTVNVVFSASPTLTGTITAGAANFSGAITASNFSGSSSGTNTGDVTLAAFGSTPNNNGASLSGQVLTLQPADGTHPGGVSTATQTFAGNKTFTGTVAVSNTSTTALTVNTTSLVVDATNNAVGIGTTPATTTVLDIVNNSGSTKAVQVTGYGSNIGFRARRANGTLATPTQSLTGDILGFYSARGYGTTAFAAASTGAINVVAGENFTDTSMRTYLTFSATPTTSVTAVEEMRIDTTGITIGPQSASTSIHQINGGLNVTTRTITANLTIDTTTSDYTIFCNQSGAISITLPAPTNGRLLIIKDISGTAETNNITLVRHAAEKIEGLATSKLLQTNWGAWTITSNGTDWFMV